VRYIKRNISSKKSIKGGKNELKTKGNAEVKMEGLLELRVKGGTSDYTLLKGVGMGGGMGGMWGLECANSKNRQECEKLGG
jgi:hypothetical protein